MKIYNLFQEKIEQQSVGTQIIPEIFDPSKINDKSMRKKLLILQSELKNPYPSTEALEKIKTELGTLKSQARDKYEDDKPKKWLRSMTKYEKKLDKHHSVMNETVSEINKLEMVVSDMLFKAQAQNITTSWVIILDSKWNPIWVNQSKLNAIPPQTVQHICNPIADNIAAGRQVWSGNVTGKNIADAWFQWLIWWGMAEAWYNSKNINNVITIAKLITAALIFKYYRDHTEWFGEKVGRWLALFGLLSNQWLGWRDMLREGSKNGVVGFDKFFKSWPTFENASIQQQYSNLETWKNKVEWLKKLFAPDKQNLLANYLSNNNANWSFDINKFLSDYDLDDQNKLNNLSHWTNTGVNDLTKKPISDLNKDAAMWVIASLIMAQKTGNTWELNKQITDYLKATWVQSPNDIINLSSQDLNIKLQEAQQNLQKQAQIDQINKQKDIIKERSNLNQWIIEVLWLTWMSIVEWQEQSVKLIKDDATLTQLEKIQLLKSQKLLRKTWKNDIPEVGLNELATINGLKKLGYSEINANLLVGSLMEVKQMMSSYPNQDPQIVFENTSIYYQNHGRRILIKSKTPQQTMKFGFWPLGLSEDIAQGTTGFTAWLLVADAVCNILKYIGTFDKSKSQEHFENVKKIGNTFPFKRSEISGSLEMNAQSTLFSFTNTNPQINSALKNAFKIGTNWLLGGQVDHTQIQNLLTKLNAATIGGENARVEWTNIKIPSILLAQNASSESTGEMNVEYNDIQSIWDVGTIIISGVSYLATGIYNRAVWNPVVDSNGKPLYGYKDKQTNQWVTTSNIQIAAANNAHPLRHTANGAIGVVLSDIIDIGWNTINSGVNVGADVINNVYKKISEGVPKVYEDFVWKQQTDSDGNNLFYYWDEKAKVNKYTTNENDPLANGAEIKPLMWRQWAFWYLYRDGKRAVISVWSDAKKWISWTIDAVGDLSKEAIDQAVGIIGNIMKEENKQIILDAINSVWDLAQGTIDRVWAIIRDSLDNTMKWTWDLIWNRDFAKLLALWAWYQFTSG